MNQRIYAYWDQSDSDEDASGYWMVFDTLEGAVLEAGDDAPIYRFEGKLLGCFKIKTSAIKVKKRRKLNKD